MELKDRLKAISQMIVDSSCTLDVGCDHAYLSIYLLEKGIAKRAIALDNKEGPLDNARKNILRAGLESKIDIVLSDGLKNIPDTLKYDYMVIAGMGGETIIDILSYKKDYTGITLILEPNRNQYSLRKYLMENGFEILDEEVVIDSSIAYPIIKCKFIGTKTIYSMDELRFGPIILKKRSKEFIYSIDKQINELEKGLINSCYKNEELKEKINDLRRIKDGAI